MAAPADERSRLLRDAADRSGRYLATLPHRSVTPDPKSIAALEHLASPLLARGEPPAAVLKALDEFGSPATVATAGGRYFGFVIGSGLPTALAANWLAGAWNQNAALASMSPVAARLESVALDWVRELLELPGSARGIFLTGDTMANVAGLAAARHAVLERVGWNLEEQGMAGSPPITVIVGAEVHASVVRAIGLLGFGQKRVVEVPTDEQGRMRADSLPRIEGPTIVCIQAGNVNTGACDPAEPICAVARDAHAWVHVDGAFGAWARAAPTRERIAAGIEHADSWALDGHKWLNLPYDSGIAFVREARHLRAAMAMGPAAYLAGSGEEHMEHAPEMSRRARGVDAWAALRSLGRDGVSELVERCCRHATLFAQLLASGGAEILNEVSLNQVLVTFGGDEATRRVIQGAQADGTCWCGGTSWHGRAAMRISVSSWATTEEDVRASAAAILRVARSATPGGR